MLKNYEFQRPVLRNIVRESEAREVALGEARRHAKAVLAFLEARAVRVPREVADRVWQCRDLAPLERLVRRAAVIASADELFADG